MRLGGDDRQNGKTRSFEHTARSMSEARSADERPLAVHSENSRAKVQIVRGDSSAARYGSCRLIDENSRGKVQNLCRNSSANRLSSSLTTKRSSRKVHLREF